MTNGYPDVKVLSVSDARQQSLDRAQGVVDALLKGTDSVMVKILVEGGQVVVVVPREEFDALDVAIGDCVAVVAQEQGISESRSRVSHPLEASARRDVDSLRPGHDMLPGDQVPAMEGAPSLSVGRSRASRRDKQRFEWLMLGIVALLMLPLLAYLIWAGRRHLGPSPVDARLHHPTVVTPNGYAIPNPSRTSPRITTATGRAPGVTERPTPTRNTGATRQGRIGPSRFWHVPPTSLSASSQIVLSVATSGHAPALARIRIGGHSSFHTRQMRIPGRSGIEVILQPRALVHGAWIESDRSIVVGQIIVHGQRTHFTYATPQPERGSRQHRRDRR